MHSIISPYFFKIYHSRLNFYTEGKKKNSEFTYSGFPPNKSLKKKPTGSSVSMKTCAYKVRVRILAAQNGHSQRGVPACDRTLTALTAVDIKLTESRAWSLISLTVANQTSAHQYSQVSAQ